MRSRYSAYALGNESYLLSTWHETTRPAHLDLAAEGKPRWLGLDIRRHAVTGARGASVEFVARYKIGGRAYRMHETSQFVLEGDRWYYIDGELHHAR